MTKPAKLTVGILVYNGAGVLERCLSSVLAQTFADIKVLIIDNASTDGSGEIAARFAERDSRVSYHRHQDNFGLKSSTLRALLCSLDSDYFSLVHCDLTWAPTYAEECLKALEADPEAVLAYSQCQFLDDKGNLLELCRDLGDFAHPDPAQRYLNILQYLGWCTAYHGIGRSRHMLPPLQGALSTRVANAAADNEYLARLALRGKLIQVEKPLFFRSKETYHLGDETWEERSRRYYRGMSLGSHLPFCNWIRLHCYDVVYSGLPPETINDLVRQTVSILLARYKTHLNYEIARAIELVLRGDFKRGWGLDEDQRPAAFMPAGQFRYLDFVHLSELNRDLEYAYVLWPDFQGLHHARALVLFLLGHLDEALAALNKELRLNPGNHAVWELKERVKAKFAARVAEVENERGYETSGA